MKTKRAVKRPFAETDKVDVFLSEVNPLHASARYPALTIPAGYAEDGAPESVIFFGGFLSKPQLLTVGYSFEQASNARRPTLRQRLKR